MQEICRFKIRQCIRQAIEKDNADYYKIKREMSTFNKNRNMKSENKTKPCNNENQTDSDDSENYDDEDDDDDDPNDDLGGGGRGNVRNSSLARFERFFRPRRGQNASYTTLDNQLRLMIYGNKICVGDWKLCFPSFPKYETFSSFLRFYCELRATNIL